MSVLEARGLRYAVGGRVILDDFDLTVGPGMRVAVVGPSGSGKTSLLALLAGLAAPAAGQVLVDQVPVVPGQVPAGGGDRAPGPRPGVAAHRRGEHRDRALRRGLAPGRAAAAAQEALASLGLAEHAGQLADELSGGQQQRVAVARALATEPAVLIADEPTAEQDSASRELVLSRMLDLAEAGKSLVLATHDPEVAQRCDRVVDLSDLRPDSVGRYGLATG